MLFLSRANRRSPDEKLLREREKALDLLWQSMSPREKSRETNDNISYLFRPYRTNDTSLHQSLEARALSVNVSELAEEKSVYMHDVPEKLTFDPKEITGRSTMFTKNRDVGNVSIENLLATSRCQNIRDMTKTYRESLGSAAGQAADFDRLVQESFQSDEFITSDNLKRNLLSDDEREWEKEYFPVPGAKYTKPRDEIAMEFDGYSGVFIPHNTSTATDQFSLGAFCNKQSESLGNIIRAESPTRQVTQGVLNTTTSSAASTVTSQWGRTYEKTPDIDSFISNLNLSASTNRLLQNMKKDLQKSKTNPLDDITKRDQNIPHGDEGAADVSHGSGKENHQKDKEYREFCRFNTSKSPRRTETLLTLTQDTVLDDREEEGVRKGARKRSRSSVCVKVNAPAAVVEYCRSKSPCERRELQAVSGTDNKTLELTATTERMLLLDTPVDPGKISLPNYGLVKGISKSPGSAGLTRTASTLSTASEFNHQEGYLPLKGTHKELSWGSVRLRTSVTKSIQIKNTSPKRLVFRAVIDGPGFQFSSADVPQMSITLQPQECRALWIVFCPTVKGPAIGSLIFKPPSPESNVKRIIPLYGYGGHASVVIKGLQQGPVGSKFLPMGDMRSLTRYFEQTITAYNRGSVASFASISIDNTRAGQRCFTTSVTVSPSQVIIPPMCSVKITLTFRPQRDELKEMLKMQKTTDVILIANLIVTTGDEPTRHRMKKLLKECPDHAVTSSTVLSHLFNHFTREQMIDHLDDLTEHPSAIVDLVQGFRSIEIALTMNNGTDDTLMDASGWMADNEDTILFKTIQEMGTEVDEEDDDNDSPNEDLIRVGPREIFWESFERETRTISIKSMSRRQLLFKMDTSHPHLVEFLPAEGEIASGDAFTILLKFTPGPMPKRMFVIRLKFENQVIQIPVHIGAIGRS
ncbi:hypothetical protein DMENIID0001_162160 [Sergentomyia squamirostris]